MKLLTLSAWHFCSGWIWWLGRCEPCEDVQWREGQCQVSSDSPMREDNMRNGRCFKKTKKKKNCRKYLFSRSVCLKTSSSLWDINNNINVNIKKIKVLWKYVANQVILISLEVWLYCIIWNSAESPLKIVRKVGKTAVHKLQDTTAIGAGS